MELSETDIYSSEGEHPGIDDDFKREVVRGLIDKIREQRSGLDSDYELGARFHLPAINGNRNGVMYDGPLDNLRFQRHPDERSLVVRLKDSTSKELHNHPLRDGVAISLIGLMVVGASLYPRLKNKK